MRERVPITKEWCITMAHAEREAELEWTITRLRSALENYGRHHPWCGYGADGSCQCGLAELLGVSSETPSRKVGAVKYPETVGPPISALQDRPNAVPRLPRAPQRSVTAMRETREYVEPFDLEVCGETGDPGCMDCVEGQCQGRNYGVIVTFYRCTECGADNVYGDDDEPCHEATCSHSPRPASTPEE